MNCAKQDQPNSDLSVRLIEHALRQDVKLDKESARRLATLGLVPAIRKLDGVCRLIHAAHDEDLRLNFPQALRRVETCGGNADEAICRLHAGGVESRAGIVETVRYAADHGIAFTPRSIEKHVRKHGYEGTRRYVDKLGAIMDAASILRIDCSQARAIRRLSLAEGNVQDVVAGFAAEHRRRSDQRAVPCRVIVPPRDLQARANALAGCGCQRCRERLAAQLQVYIDKMISNPFFGHLDREEARAEANLELIRSIDKWPGGANFTGWFAARFQTTVRKIYASRPSEEDDMLRLDAPAVLADDQGGHLVPLGERIPDRTVDVLEIVLFRERVAEAELELRRQRADRGAEFTKRCSPAPAASTPAG